MHVYNENKGGKANMLFRSVRERQTKTKKEEVMGRKEGEKKRGKDLY